MNNIADIRAVHQALEAMAKMSDEDRVKFIAELCGAYCQDCGRKQPKGKPCQCWNDERSCPSYLSARDSRCTA
jgi:hypothetical protein